MDFCPCLRPLSLGKMFFGILIFLKYMGLKPEGGGVVITCIIILWVSVVENEFCKNEFRDGGRTGALILFIS